MKPSPLQYANMRLTEIEKIGGWVFWILTFLFAGLFLK